MKNIIIAVFIALITSCINTESYAIPLQGIIITSSGETMPLGGKAWYSSYMNLTPPRSFVQGEQLKIKLQGKAKWVYVRLLPEGADATGPTGLIERRITVPQQGIITVTLENNYPNTQQISVHSGHEAFEKLLTPFNETADIISINLLTE